MNYKSDSLRKTSDHFSPQQLHAPIELLNPETILIFVIIFKIKKRKRKNNAKKSIKDTHHTYHTRKRITKKDFDRIKNFLF